jgi:DedD protein
MFKSRSGSQGNPTTPAPQSIEEVRRRARHRLIGASVLVLLGVLGFPLLFDTQPRPISVEIPIEIPAKGSSPALVLPKKAAAISAGPEPLAEAPAASTTAAEKPQPDRVTSAESLSDREEVLPPNPAPAKAASPVEPSAPVKAEPVQAPAPKPASPPAVSVAAAESTRAKALLEGKPVAATATANQRIVVQVGAFAEEARVREVRLKVEAAGLKTYTHVAQTAEGSRIRVRVGPFATRAEADKAAARLKSLGLPAAILTL